MNAVSGASVSAIVRHPATKPVLFVLAMLPLVLLVVGVVERTLGANPAETLIRSLGDWTLRFLCLTLAVTPLRQWTGLVALARWRRMLGLFTYYYAVWHMLSYAWLDMGFYVDDIAKDIAKRPFILVGFTALVLLTPLAATSFNRAAKAMGAANWQRLHRLVYVIVMLALLHFFWMRAGKNNFAEVFVYASIVAVLLGARVVKRRRSATAVRRPARVTS